jgi:hypothetical protein
MIITIGGILWSIFKGTKMYRESINKTYLLAIECVGAGVLSALDAYKYKKGGGTLKDILTDEDIKEYKETAKKVAKEVGNKNGINIVSILGGEEFVNLHIEKQLKRLL